jgi:glycine reductase
MLRVVHYLNQFFGQIGGEEHAGVGPQAIAKPVGPGLALQAAMNGKAAVAGTVICGDNYFAEQPDKATAEVIALIRQFDPQIVIAGPAFNAGRYGPACGAVCKAVQESLGIPAITAMYPENPGVEIYRKYIWCVKTGPSVAGMRQALDSMARLAMKIANGEPLGSPDEEGCIPRGLRRNCFAGKTGAARAVDMLLDKLQAKPFKTELPMPVFEQVPPASPVEDLKAARVALVTEGGIVPKGNPDHLESARASKFLRYELAGIDDLTGNAFESIHGGYFNGFASDDPDRVVPVDVMRDLVRDGVIREMADYFYTTTGNGTTLENARGFGREIAARLKQDGVQAVILTST